MSSFPPEIFQTCANEFAVPSCIQNIGADRGNIAKLQSNRNNVETLTVRNITVTQSMDFPDNSLHLLTSGAGETIVAVGDLTNDTFTLKSIVAGTDIVLTPANDTLQIGATGAAAVQLQTAGGGGTQTLVNDGVGPVLKLASLSGSGINVTLNGGGNAVTIAVDQIFATAGGDPITAAGPSSLKGTGNTDLLRDASTATEIRYDNQCCRIRDSAGNLPPVIDDANATGDSSIAIGANASAQSTNAIAVGVNSFSQNNNCVAVGHLAVAQSGNNAVAIGHSCEASQQGPIAIGRTCVVTKEGSVGIGQEVNLTTSNNIGIGTNLTLTNNPGILVGNAASGTFAQTVAIGALAATSEGYTYAIGSGATADDDHSIAIGPNVVTGNKSYQNAIGFGASAVQPFSIAETPDSAFAAGRRTNALSQVNYCSFSQVTTYLMGATWSRHNFIIVPNVIDYSAPASDLGGALFSLNFPATVTFRMPSSLALVCCVDRGVLVDKAAHNNNVVLHFHQQQHRWPCDIAISCGSIFRSTVMELLR
jgi:hypothetical protein